MNELDIKKLLNIFYIHKGIAIAVFVVIFPLSVYLAWSLPDVYRSRTLIQIIPPKLPPGYVATQSTPMNIEQRVRQISDEILSRPNLQRIVAEFNLYPDQSRIDTRVDTLRKRIALDIRRTDAFALSFDDVSPEKAKDVTARLGAIFIDATQQMRQQQITGTATFINSEADRLRKELETQESAVNLYKAQYRAELPEQLDANLRTIDQFRREYESGMLRYTSLQERKGNLEKQIAEWEILAMADSMLPGISSGGANPQKITGSVSLEGKKRELDIMLRQYSPKHPDVIRLKREIDALESQAASATSAATGSSGPVVTSSPGASLKEMLSSQIEDLKLEIAALKSKNDMLRSQIADYQKRVDNTPLRAIELSKITRVYDITLKKYQDLQAKSLETQISENMERKDKGEKFNVIDPANLPQVPIGPNRPRIIIVGLVLGLGAGVGMAFLRETLDTSFKRAEDLRDNIPLPILATIPAVITRGSLIEQRRAQRMLVFASIGMLFVGAVVIRFFGNLLN